ncbi:Ger(x)C family spore germination protein [Cohnella sp.]|uniref:Ger(x)C family spore germination protein n=1 Tax=Cohnella sp. TaxID=1883426 RepID=UPI0035638113
MKAKWMMPTIMLMGMAMLLTSCWNMRSLKDLAIIVVMGIDKAPKNNEYQVSFQIVNTEAVAPGAKGGGGNVTPVTVYSGTGNTLFEAIRKSSQKVPRRLFFAHVQMLIIGESFAKEGINELFDFFERSHELRLTSTILVSRGVDAGTVVRILTPLEKIPANSIAGKLKFTSKVWSENIEVDIEDVIKAVVSKGREPVISGVSILGNTEKGRGVSNMEQTTPPATIEINGIGLFKDGKLKSWLDGREARGAVWIQNKMKSTILELDCKKKKDAIAIEIIRSQTNVEAEVQAGKPRINIHIREEGNVGEIKCPIDLSKKEEIEKLEQAWVKETKKEVMEAIETAQSEKSDIFGFGEAVDRANPKAWEKMKEDWNETFAVSEVDVKVDAFIRRPGMRVNSYLSELK